MRVERLSKSWLLRYERGSVLLIARNAYAIQEALLICRGYRGALAIEYNFTSPQRPPLSPHGVAFMIARCVWTY
jgi:hypothetical protein